VTTTWPQALAHQRLCVHMTGSLIVVVSYGETTYCRRILSIAFPFASSSISLSK